MKKFYNDYLSSNVPFHLFSIIAVVLIVASWFVPPIGAIDGSVIAATGEIFAFAALWTVIKAIDKGTNASIRKGDVSVTINKDGNNQSEETEIC